MEIIITLISFVLMECVAWLTHKYIMHGFLWKWHKDHHNHGHDSVFEKNDLFFLVFSIPSMLCFIIGSFYPTMYILLYVGLGILLYGMAYFFIHDVFIHQRIRLFHNSNNFYLKAIRRAHKMHHKHLEKYGGVCFGMLWVPLKYYKEAFLMAKYNRVKDVAELL